MPEYPAGGCCMTASTVHSLKAYAIKRIDAEAQLEDGQRRSKTSIMSYNPGGWRTTHLVARRAPRANVSRLLAR